MRKRDRERFIRKACELIESLGAESDGDYWHLDTQCGRLRLHVVENAIEGPGTVFTRFEEPERARLLVECNPYSGKWNHHYFGTWRVDDALADLQYQLERIRCPTSREQR